MKKILILTTISLLSPFFYSGLIARGLQARSLNAQPMLPLAINTAKNIAVGIGVGYTGYKAIKAARAPRMSRTTTTTTNKKTNKRR